MCVHAKVNKMGFIETPYRKINEGVLDVKNDPRYLSAEEEDFKKIIAQANAPIDMQGVFETDRAKCRQNMVISLY